MTVPHHVGESVTEQEMFDRLGRREQPSVREKLEQIIGSGTGNADHSIPEALRLLADELDHLNCWLLSKPDIENVV